MQRNVSLYSDLCANGICLSFNLTDISHCCTGLRKLWRLVLSTRPVHLSAWHAQGWQDSPSPLVELNTTSFVLKRSTFYVILRYLRLQKFILRVITAFNLGQRVCRKHTINCFLELRSIANLRSYGNAICICSTNSEQEKAACQFLYLSSIDVV